jgi:quaternary ammonium compound-resistance protein SugE
MEWLYLSPAGLLEVIWAVGLKYTGGWARFWPSMATIAAMIASVYFLAIAVKSVPLGTGYATWTGIGAVGTAILGIVLFAELATPPRLACIALIVTGIAGLKLTSQEAEERQ